MMKSHLPLARSISRSLLAVSFASMAAPRAASAAPLVWALDDGDKIKRDAIDTPRSRGIDNAVWSPGQPIRLFALRNETVAFQVVVQADQAALDGVSVDFTELAGPGGASIRNAPGADPSQFVGRPIERFVEHYFEIERPSGSESDPSDALGWSPGSGPAPGTFTGFVPDALIPVEIAPAWDPYPLHVAAGSNGAIWIDVTVAPDQAPGTYRGNVLVQTGTTALATLPVELEVVAATLPDRPALATMLYYGKSELDQRIGGGASVEKQLWQLFHRHRLSAMHSAKTTADLQAQLPALDGTAFTRAQGYEGPGQGAGDGILSLGTYGTYGNPSDQTLGNVEAIADVLAQKGLFDTTDVFVYAVDESCGSSRGQAWKSLLSGSSDSNAKKVKVGWTCSQSPASQPVDIPIVYASSFDPAAAENAESRGKKVWVYNGSFPQAGTFLTDVEATSPRMNGWIGGMFDIGRWFYWETTFWYDDNRGGKGAYDPFTVAETFHNSDGDYCEGDGVLVYPGSQVDQFRDHSIGFPGVLPSIRLKNLRRGVEDAGYYQLARAAAPQAAQAIGSALLPNVLTTAKRGDPLSAPDVGKSFFDARKKLLDLVPREAIPGSDAGPASPDAGAPAPQNDAGAKGPGAALDAGTVAPADAGGRSTVDAAGDTLVEAAVGAPNGADAAPDRATPGLGNDGAADGHDDASSGCSLAPARADAGSGWPLAVIACAAVAARRRRRQVQPGS